MAYWIDIGVNLTNSRFDKDREAVIGQAQEAAVSQMIVTGTDLNESEQALELAQQYPDLLYATAGVHPHDAKSYTPATHSALSALHKEAAVVAVGETGLDFNRNFSTPEQQKHAFEQQLELANLSGLPLFLHERDAFKTQFEMLKAHRDAISGGVQHCFTGSKEALYAYLDLDLYIGITGWLCDERRGEELQKLVKDIPADRLLLETDAPYLTPRSLRPKPKSSRNLPAYLPHIAETAARLRCEETQALMEQVQQNTLRLFSKIQPAQAGC